MSYNLAKNKPLYVTCLLASIIMGVGVVIVVQSNIKWYLFLLLAALLFLIIIIASDKEKIFLALLVLSLPLWIGMHLSYIDTTARSTFGFPVHVSLFPLAALYIISFCKGDRGPLLRGLFPLAGLFGVAVISAFMAHDKLFAMFDLFALSTCFLLFFAGSKIDSPRNLWFVIQMLMVAATLQAMVGFLQGVTGSPLEFLYVFGGPHEATTLQGYTASGSFTRVAGLMGHPNSLAMFVDLMLPVTVSFLFYPFKRPYKMLLLGVAGAQVLALGLTGSRGGISASILAVLLMLFLQWQPRLGLVRTLVTLSMIAVVFFLAVVIIPNPIYRALTREESATAYGRIPLVKVAVNMISHHPLFGVGLNNYVRTSRQYDHTPEQLSSYEGWNAPVHNLFLFIAGEIGLVGVGCFLALVGTLVWALGPALRSGDPLFRCTALGLLCGLIAFFTQSQFDYSVWTQNRVLWFYFGLMASCGSLAKTNSRAADAKDIASSNLPA
jgi:putative inorganic carbon (hco3(-)) transporter